MELAVASRRGLIAGGLLLTVVLLVLLSRFVRHDRVEGHAFDIPSADHRIIVEVLNGSGRPGLARLGTRRLRRMGVDVVYFGNADSVVDSTRIVVRRGSAAVASQVRQALGTGRVGSKPDSLRRVDVSVILGPDYQPDEDGRP
ncbi:MAG: LytR C-terminal domain-containing protein [Gemmatimonadales bacterium]